MSVAQLVHNGQAGNTFLVYDHTTDQYYTEQTRRSMRNAGRGLTKMVLRLPLAIQVLLFVAIVTIPLMLIFGIGGQWQLRRFRKRRHHGIRALVTAFIQAAALMPAAPSAATASRPPQNLPGAGAPDLVAQVQQITELHMAGALTAQEFQLAKARLLNTGPVARAEPSAEQFAPPAQAVQTPALAFPDRSLASAPQPVPWSPDRRYWWDGSKWMLATTSVPPGSLVSEDQRWWWDGNSWRAVPAT